MVGHHNLNLLTEAFRDHHPSPKQPIQGHLYLMVEHHRLNPPLQVLHLKVLEFHHLHLSHLTEDHPQVLQGGVLLEGHHNLNQLTKALPLEALRSHHPLLKQPAK